eukprot:gene10946-11100_t
MVKSKSTVAAKADGKQKPEHKAEEVKRLQASYKTFFNKKLASGGNKSSFFQPFSSDLKAETSPLGCLLRLRLLLDKYDELSKLEGPSKVNRDLFKNPLCAAVSDAAQHYRGQPSSGPLSLSLAIACVQAHELLLKEELGADSTLQGQVAKQLGEVISACILQAGYSPEASFSKGALVKAFYDPKSENFKEEEAKGSTSEQLEITDKMKSAEQQQQQRQHDKGSLKDKMEAPAGKRGAIRGVGRGADVERTRDIKRGRGLPADKSNEQQEQLLKLQEALKKEADSVVAFLESKLKGLAGEGFVQELQNITKLDASDLLKSLNTPAPPVVPLPAAATSLAQFVCQQAKMQLLAVPGSDMAIKVKHQLQQLLKNDSWQLYSFEEPSGFGNSGGKLVTFSSRVEFEQAVKEKQLLGSAAEDMTKRLVVQEASPSLVDAFDLTEEMEDVLEDAAGKQLMQGMHDVCENAWVSAFKQECPLEKYVRTVSALPTQETYMPTTPLNEPADQERLHAALGFALLQWERQAVSCDRVQLSNKPEWVVLCFNMLQLLLPVSGADPEQRDFVIYSYLLGKASRQLHKVIRHPEAEDCLVAGGEASSSMTDGLLQDNLTMLTMLQAGGMLSGPALLALQLYLVRHTGSPAKLGKPCKGKAGKADDHLRRWQAKLAELQEPQQVSLRWFLLQLVCDSFVRLPTYDSFLQDFVQQYQQPELVPVQPKASERPAGSKGRDKKDEEVELLLSAAYYEQSCFNAAKPHDQNYPCCLKHVNLRVQAEADGKPYSPFDQSLPEDDFGCMLLSQYTGMVDRKFMQRYLIETAAVVQAREQQGIKSDSRAGLEALVNGLYDLDDMNKHLTLFSAPQPNYSSLLDRSLWDKARFDLLAATQLAMHRRQLYAMVTAQSEWLQVQGKHVNANVARDRMRALLCQRVAGEAWLHMQWRKIFEQELERLAGEKEKANRELRDLEQMQGDKSSGGKAAMNKEVAKEKAQAAKQKLVEVQSKLGSLETATFNAKALYAKLTNEAESFPDLIRANYGTEAMSGRGMLEPLKEVMVLLINDLMDIKQPTSAELMARMSDALQLTRMKLFELDIWSVHSSLAARKKVLVQMWQGKQTVAVVLVSKEALKQKLNEGIRLNTEAELLADTAFVEKQAQPAKASKGKKKKKGPAAQPKKFFKVSEDEEEEEATAAAAAAADAKAAADEAAEESEPEQQADEVAEEQDQAAEEDDTWSSYAHVDMTTLEYSGPKVDRQQQQQQPPAADGWERSSRSVNSSGPGTRQQTGTGAEFAAPLRAPASASSRSSGSAARVDAGSGAGADSSKGAEKKYCFYNRFCSRCYHYDHFEKDCPYSAACPTCGKWGHDAGRCTEACKCGRLDRHNDRDCKLACKHCGRVGHKLFTCPDHQCGKCGQYGHLDRDCQEKYCTYCQKLGHRSTECRVARCQNKLALAEYVSALLAEENAWKLNVLIRIPQQNLEDFLSKPNPGALLESVVNHMLDTRSSSQRSSSQRSSSQASSQATLQVPPKMLSDAEAAHLNSSLGAAWARAVGDWRHDPSWDMVLHRLKMVRDSQVRDKFIQLRDDLCAEVLRRKMQQPTAKPGSEQSRQLWDASAGAAGAGGGHGMPAQGPYAAPPATGYGAVPGSAAAAGAGGWPAAADQQQQEWAIDAFSVADSAQIQERKKDIDLLALHLHQHESMLAAIEGLVDEPELRTELRAAAKLPSQADMVLQVKTCATRYAAQLREQLIMLPEFQQNKFLFLYYPSLGAEVTSAAKRATPAVSAAGLANEAGEYNCFLNVVVQCLWSCRAFREQVVQLPEHERGHPVVAALLRLFGQMQDAERGWQPGHDRVVVNPSELREALDQGTQFRRQEMNDANELLDTLYECFKQAQAPSQYPNGRGILVDSVFGLLLREEVRCQQCHTVSHLVVSHFEHMMVVNSMALTMVAADYPQGADMGTLLRLLQDQDQKSCDKDIGGCGAILTPTRFLEHPPQVLTIQLAWYQDVSGEEIGEALQHVQERVDVQNVYPDCDSAATTYQISSTVAYYGQHYMAFVHNSKLNTWLLFDDATVSAVGSWQDVIRKGAGAAAGATGGHGHTTGPGLADSRGRGRA